MEINKGYIFSITMGSIIFILILIVIIGSFLEIKESKAEFNCRSLQSKILCNHYNQEYLYYSGYDDVYCRSTWGEVFNYKIGFNCEVLE